MDEEHVSSTTADIGDLADAPQPDFGAEDAGFRENNEALAKHAVDDDINSDLMDGESDAIQPHDAEEDPSRETVSESPRPEFPVATEPEAPPPLDCAVAESKQEPTKPDAEDLTSEPEKEESRIEEHLTEDKIIEPETEDRIAKPETEDKTIVPPEAEDTHRPDAPAKAPASVEESPSPSRTGEPHETIISSSAASPPQLLSSSVVDLLYWRDIKTTGVVFGASLFLLLSLTVCSIVSVCSYVALTLLSVTITFRIYKGILQAVQKSDEGHPFKAYLDQDVALSEDVVHKYSDMALERVNTWIAELRRLFLVEDLVDSLKFAVGMWVLTYVGALFNGLTLIILALIAGFSCPVIYEKNQKQIDHYLELVTSQIKDVVGKVQAKVPGLKRKTE